MSYHERKVSSFHVNCIPDIFNDMAYSHLDHTHKDGGKCCREEDYRVTEMSFTKMSFFQKVCIKN